MIIAITGVPGTGKSSVSRILGRLLDYRVVDVNSLAREKKLLKGYDRKRQTYVADLGAISREVRRLGRLNKGDLVVEGHYSEEVCRPDVVFVLRCNPRVLARRLGRRKYARGKIRENVLAEVLDSSTINALKRCARVFEVETSGLKPGETAKLVLKMVRNPGGERRNGIDYARYLDFAVSL